MSIEQPPGPRPPAEEALSARSRRMRAAALFAEGATQAEVARALELSRQTISRWHARWRQEGAAGLDDQKRRGPRSRLTEADLQRVDAALRRGPRAHGLPDERWTCRQVGWVVEETTGVIYHPAHISRMIRRHDWPVEPPFPSAKPDEV